MRENDPLRNFRFTLEIPDVGQAGFSECTGFDISTEAIEYREGTGRFQFDWSPACQEVVLRVWVREAGGSERELKPSKEWRGPLSFPTFIQEALPRGRDRFQWQLSYSGAPEVLVEYEVRGGEQLRNIRHVSPPRTVQE